MNEFRRLHIVILLFFLMSILLRAQEKEKVTPTTTPAPEQSKTLSEETPAVPEPNPTQSLPSISYNDMAPLIVADELMVPKLKTLAPQWAVQQLDWVKPDEVDKYKGRASSEQVAECMKWILQTIRSSLIPQDLSEHLIPLRNWSIFYRDWIDHGGSDTFVVKYKLGSLVIRISETANYILVAVRDLKQQQNYPKEEHISFVLNMASEVLTPALQPESADAVSISNETKTGIATEGFWAASMTAHTNQPDTQGKQKSSQGVISDGVKFFTNGRFVIFQVLKYIWTNKLNNPFEPRFSLEVDDKVDESIWSIVEKEIKENPDLATPEERIRFYERMKLRIVAKQVEEYLGPLLYDYEGNKLTATIPISQIEKAFNDLNSVQKDYLLKQRKSDEYYIEGLKAFNEKRYDVAVDKWSEALRIDPLNVRCALLLSIAEDYLKEKMYRTLGKVDFQNPTLKKAVEALNNHQSAILNYELTQRIETVKEREIARHRVRAIDLYSEGRYREAIEEWDKVIKIDPGNPQAALFKDLALKRLKETESQETQKKESQ
ncbi:hypothetical protein J7M23_00595 [Candidatus Sumerlaeota bacterium]|nr:hypothetical protein [Candidatus Sumerlaeota bacterium]